MKRFRILVGAFSLLLPSLTLPAESDLYERELLHALEAMLKYDSVSAGIQLEALTRSYPESRVAHLLYADLLAAQGGLSSVIGQEMGHVKRDVVSDLRAQLRARWHYWRNVRAAQQDKVPSALLQIARTHRHVIYMDIPASRLFVFESRLDGLKQVTSFYASIGISGFGKRRQGDQKTPVGVYRITGFIPSRNLHERYGSGALPIDYPNDLDQLYERSGDGIWLHGTEPGFVNRAPLASDGCVSLANQDFLRLHRLIGPVESIPVVLDSTPNWIPREELAKRREKFTSIIEQWYRAWSGTDSDTLDAFYQTSSHPQFRKIKSTLGSTNGSPNTALNLDIGQMQLFTYPGEKDLYLAELSFENKKSLRIDLRQYWMFLEEQHWQILAETWLPLIPTGDTSSNEVSDTELPNSE